jgi:hypothetical protein
MLDSKDEAFFEKNREFLLNVSINQRIISWLDMNYPIKSQASGVV